MNKAYNGRIEQTSQLAIYAFMSIKQRFPLGHKSDFAPELRY